MTFAFGDAKWPGVAKLTEEAGELIQVVGKLMMTHGEATHWDGTDLRVRFVLELGDLAAAIQFVVGRVLTIDEVRLLRTRIQEKFEKFEQWHREQGEPG